MEITYTHTSTRKDRKRKRDMQTEKERESGERMTKHRHICETERLTKKI
jgi:hypothetical protein